MDKGNDKDIQTDNTTDLIEEYDALLSYPNTNDNPNWWWYLYEIAKGKYPTEQLPEHLRDIYIGRA